MEPQNLILTQTDRLILASYSSLLDGLADYLGEGCEVALHSLEDMEHSVVKIVNGHHTGRKAGAPITDLALAMLNRITKQEGIKSISYFAQNKKGEPLKSATIPILGEGKRIIGLLCINFYLNTPLSQILGMFSPTAAVPAGVAETFGENTTDLVEQAVAQARLQVEAQVTIPPSLKNRQIIALLHSQGIFNLKNAVELVASAMGISKNTVYLHLRHVKEEKIDKAF